MAERATIARPYAKAAFLYAQGANAFAQWSKELAIAAQIAADPRVADLIGSPQYSQTQVIEMLQGVAGAPFDPAVQNFIRLLAENHRLHVLPEIAAHYELLRSQVENTVDVEVISAVALDEAQKEKLGRALHTRLKRQVRMQNTVDPTLLGGAVVRAGDLVIDGSIKGRLERLATELEG